MNKTYTQPKFELVKSDEQNRVFFAASVEGPTLETVQRTTSEW